MIDAYRALARALIARGGERCRIVRASDHPWASLTFEGARHAVEIELPADAADRFADGIVEAEFDLPGHIVADVAVVGREEARGLVRLRVEALTLVGS